jgi:hypothetical protein
MCILSYSLTPEIISIAAIPNSESAPSSEIFEFLPHNDRNQRRQTTFTS